MKTGNPNRPSQQHQVQQSDAQRGQRDASQKPCDDALNQDKRRQEHVEAEEEEEE